MNIYVFYIDALFARTTMEFFLLLTAFSAFIASEYFFWIFHVADPAFITVIWLIFVSNKAFFAFFTMKVLFFNPWIPNYTLFAIKKIIFVSKSTLLWIYLKEIITLFSRVTVYTIFTSKPFFIFGMIFLAIFTFFSWNLISWKYLIFSAIISDIMHIVSWIF